VLGVEVALFDLPQRDWWRRFEITSTTNPVVEHPTLLSFLTTESPRGLTRSRGNPVRTLELLFALLDEAENRELAGRIRDKELYRPLGWPSWRSFCAFFSPEEPERIDILIRALEVLESRGEKRDFGLPEARELVLRDKPGRPRKDDGNSRDHENIGGRTDTVAYVKARLRRADPELLARVEAGELSANRAAIQKGWRKEPATRTGSWSSGGTRRRRRTAPASAPT
jgi:hypothetical protein